MSSLNPQRVLPATATFAATFAEVTRQEQEDNGRAAAPSGADADACIALLTEFCRFGFRRTSMVGLAEATKVSRQTLYNRFGTKEAVLNWAVYGLSAHVRAQALDHLAGSTNNPGTVLQEVFWRWLGTVAVMLHEHRHAEEIFGLGKVALAKNQRDPLEAISGEVAGFLRRRNVRSTNKEASDTAFLLAMSAKGLMQICASETAFRNGMARVLAGAGIK